MRRLQSPVNLYCTCNCNLYTRQPSPYPSLRAPPALARGPAQKNYQNSTGIIDKQLFRRLRTPYIVEPLKYDVLRTREPRTSHFATSYKTNEIRISHPNNHLYCRSAEMRCAQDSRTTHICNPRIDELTGFRNATCVKPTKYTHLILRPLQN